MSFFHSLLTVVILIFPFSGRGEILPGLFKESPEVKQAVCSSQVNRSGAFWYKLISSHIDRLIKESGQQGLEEDVLKNLLVTLSYLELSKVTSPEVRMMGYTYSHASHHLGRLVRYYYWKDFQDLPLARQDQELISGTLLGGVVKTFPEMLSRKLMTHSLNLYKTLSWSLAASSICGKSYVKTLLTQSSSHDEWSLVLPGLPRVRHQAVLSKLKSAFEASSQESFMANFVAFEQSYLQHTMYAVPEIFLPTSLGVLDKMRFIPFGGERKLSYFEWCQAKGCRKSSIHLESRILFDQTVILAEIHDLNNDPEVMALRIGQSQIPSVARFILNDLFPQRMDLNDEILVFER